MNDLLERVKDATIKEISFVQTPANGEEFALKKSLFEDEEEPTLGELTKGVDGDLAVLLAESLEVETQEMMDVIEDMDGLIEMKFSQVIQVLADRMNKKPENIAQALLNGMEEEMERSVSEEETEKDVTESDQTNTQEESQDMSEQDKQQDDDVEKSDSEEEGGQDMSEEENENQEVEKDLPEDIEKKLDRLEELEKEQEQTKEELQKERELRIRKEYIEKARTDYDVVASSPEELGPVLKEIDENLEEEVADEVKSLIKAGYQQAEEAGLFEKFGTSTGQSDAASEIEKKVDEKMEKEDVSEAQARADVWSENPELVDRVRSN